MCTAADNVANNWDVKGRPSTPVECVRGQSYVSVRTVLHYTGKAFSSCFDGFIARGCLLLLPLLGALSTE